MNRKEFLKSLLLFGAIGKANPINAISEKLDENGIRMPTIFIGHGSPMNGIEQNEFTDNWSKLGQEIPKPEAVLVVSAHWLTKGTNVTAMNAPKTIHDFGGFGRELYEVEYPAKGNPELAKETQQLVATTDIHLDYEWGLDHGAWSVVKQMYPKANIPVIQLSIDYHKGPQYHYTLSQQLQSLRKKGVLILGSGNIVHNVHQADPSKGYMADKAGIHPEYGYDWAIEFNEKMKELISSGKHQEVVSYKKLGKIAKLAHPTPDHFYPLLYTLGVASEEDQVTFFNDKLMVGSLSMMSVKLG